MIDFIVRPLRDGSERLRLEMMPTVIVRSRPNGLPMAYTFWPTRRLDESPNSTGNRISRRGVDQQDGDVEHGIGTDQAPRRSVSPLNSVTRILGAFDHVVVRQDVPFLVEHRAGPCPFGRLQGEEERRPRDPAS